MMRKLCPVCNGKGTVDDPMWATRPIWYVTGSSCPQIQCQNCFGTGWTGVPDGIIQHQSSEPGTDISYKEGREDGS